MLFLPDFPAEGCYLESLTMHTPMPVLPIISNKPSLNPFDIALIAVHNKRHLTLSA